MNVSTSLSKNEWYEREIVDRVTQYRHLDRDYYLDTMKNVKNEKTTGYLDRLSNWRFNAENN